MQTIRGMKLPALEKEKVFGKTVLLRADLDVPIKIQNSKFKIQNSVEDDTRLVTALPTIEFLLKHNAKVIITGHLGRPDGIDKNLSLEPIADWLAKGFKIYDLRFMKIGGFDGWKIDDNLFLLENLRFYKGEEDNDQEFARRLARLADIYVNDAFAVCHRAHASIVGIPKYLPHFAGLHLQEEVKILSGVLENPKRPLVVIIGGAKIETKLPLVEKMRDFADYVLVGGKIAKELTEILKAQHQEFEKRKATLLVADLNPDGFDITSKSIDSFLQIANLAKTIVWNGPVGLISSALIHSTSSGQISKLDTERGTWELAHGIIKSKVYSVVGGGDTVGFLRQLRLLDKFSFVSTGGGAMLEFLSGKNLPGLIAIRL